MTHPPDATMLARQLFNQSGGSAALQEFAFQPRNYVRGPGAFAPEYASQVISQALQENSLPRAEIGGVYRHLVRLIYLFWEMICESQRLMRYSYPED